jgi:hypothetical protein
MSDSCEVMDDWIMEKQAKKDRRQESDTDTDTAEAEADLTHADNSAMFGDTVI